MSDGIPPDVALSAETLLSVDDEQAALDLEEKLLEDTDNGLQPGDPDDQPDPT